MIFVKVGHGLKSNAKDPHQIWSISFVRLLTIESC